MRSPSCLILLAYCLIFLTGCIEYRFDQLPGRDQYLGWVNTKEELDPKMGPKGKLYITPTRDTHLYGGGDFSKRRLTISVGMIHYLNETISLELGFRRQVFETEDNNFGDTTGSISWNENNGDDLFYIGGRIIF